MGYDRTSRTSDARKRNSLTQQIVLRDIAATFTSEDIEKLKYRTYRNWNIYRIPWDEVNGIAITKVAATRFEFMDARSPVVHKDYPTGNAVGEEVAEMKVLTMIDKIEAAGGIEEWIIKNPTGVSF